MVLKAELNISSTVKRLLLFFIAVPLLLSLMLVSFAGYLPLNLLIFLVAAGASYEMAKLLQKCGYPVRPILAMFLGVSLPIFLYIRTFPLPFSHWLNRGLLFTLLATIILIIPVFAARNVTMKQRMQTVIGCWTILFYPSYFISYWVELTQHNNAVFWLILFTLGVQLNDSFAWLVGKFFGRVRNVVLVSPNKSVTGFVGGISATVLLFFATRFLFPQYFSQDLSWWLLLAIAIVLAAIAIIGDLVESMLKRAAGVKDSGVIIFGRGGLLDSTDSLLLSAPVYIYLLPFLAI